MGTALKSPFSDDVIQELIANHPDLAGVDKKMIDKVIFSLIAINFPINNKGKNYFSIVKHADRDPEIAFSANGLKQLLISIGLFQRIAFQVVFAENIVKLDKLIGNQFNWDIAANKEKTPVGVVAYIKLLNGYEEELFFNSDDLKKQMQAEDMATFNVLKQRSSQFVLDFACKAVLRELVKTVLPFHKEIDKILSLDNQDAVFILGKFKIDANDTNDTSEQNDKLPEPETATENNNANNKTPYAANPEKGDSVKKPNSVTTPTPTVVTDKTQQHDVKSTPENNPNLSPATVLGGRSGWKIVCYDVVWKIQDDWTTNTI